jgi:hypothetical protein
MGRYGKAVVRAAQGPAKELGGVQLFQNRLVEPNTSEKLLSSGRVQGPEESPSADLRFRIGSRDDVAERIQVLLLLEVGPTHKIRI